MTKTEKIMFNKFCKMFADCIIDGNNNICQNQKYSFKYFTELFYDYNKQSIIEN